MDGLNSLGYRALGSRSKRFSDYCFEQMRQVLDALSIPFEPNFYPYAAHIHQAPGETIVDLSKSLGISHPAASKMVKRLVESGFVQLRNDKTDRRNKRLFLTPEGEAEFAHVQLVLRTTESILLELEPTGTLLECFAHYEAAFAKQSLKMRLLRLLMDKLPLHVVPYSPALHGFYENHNRIWVQRNFVLEPSDIAQLTDPQTHILDKGGLIYILCLGDYPVGGFSLLKEGEDLYQLSKMYVPEGLHGLGIGNRLLPIAFDEARRIGCRLLYLLSNTKQAPAIHLYRKLGFTEVPMTEEGKRLFARANIKMEMAL